MKYYKRLGLYKASNVTFNPHTLEAHSYKWWRFVAKVDGKIVFNNFRYSPSTGKHQYKISRLMDELGIKVDLYLPLERGIESESLESLIIQAEELLCDKFLREKLKAQQRYATNKARKLEAPKPVLIERPTLQLVVSQ